MCSAIELLDSMTPFSFDTAAMTRVARVARNLRYLRTRQVDYVHANPA